MVSELIDSNNQWDMVKLRNNLSPSSAISALQTPISWNAVDIMFWPHSPTGNYSVKSGYITIHQIPDTTLNQNANINLPSSSSPFPIDIWSITWKTYAPNKIKHFIWRVCHNILPTKTNLFKKKISQTPLGPICNSEPESIEHLFLLCPWTRPLWFGLQFLPTPSPSGLSSIHQWILNSVNLYLTTNPDLCTRLFFTLWNIWKVRNEVYFDQISPNPIATLHKINILCSDFLTAKKPNPQIPNPLIPNQPKPNLSEFPVKWRPPQSGVMKVNCDASFEIASAKGTIGIIARDEQGNILTGSYKQIFASSPLMAEALALREAVSFASNLDFPQVIFESDCLVLVEACKGYRNKGEIMGLVKDINVMRSRFMFSGITWVGRKGNCVAHTIAELGAKGLLRNSWLQNPCDQLRSGIVEDMKGLFE